MCREQRHRRIKLTTLDWIKSVIHGNCFELGKYHWIYYFILWGLVLHLAVSFIQKSKSRFQNNSSFISNSDTHTSEYFRTMQFFIQAFSAIRGIRKLLPFLPSSIVSHYSTQGSLTPRCVLTCKCFAWTHRSRISCQCGRQNPMQLPTSYYSQSMLFPCGPKRFSWCHDGVPTIMMHAPRSPCNVYDCVGHAYSQPRIRIWSRQLRWCRFVSKRPDLRIR